MTVAFKHVRDFLDELELDVDKVDRKIVRVETVREFRSGLPNIGTVVVTSTARVAGEIVSLEHVCGEHWGDGFEKENAATDDFRTATETLIREFCRDHGLEVRGGRLE